MKEKIFKRLRKIYNKIDCELEAKHCRFCVECCLDISDLNVTPLEIDYINYYDSTQTISWQEYNNKTICPYCDIEKRKCLIYELRPRFCRIFGHFLENYYNFYSACVYRESHTVYDKNSIDKIPYHKEFCELVKEYIYNLHGKEQEEYFQTLAHPLREAEKIRNSIPEYMEAINKTPGYASLYYHLGKSYSSLNMKNEAINCLLKSLTLDPTQFQAYNLLSFRFYELGFIDYAIISMKRALRSAPWNNRAIFSLGLFYFEAGKFKEALENFEKLINQKENFEGLENYIKIARELLI